jgi:hypothetical protein
VVLRVCGTNFAIFDPKLIPMVPAMHQNIQQHIYTL